MFLLTVLAVVVSVSLAALTRGRAAGLCVAWVAVFLCPAWMEREFGAFSLTPRLIAVTVAVGALVVLVDSLKIDKRLVLTDFLVIGIAIVELTSMYYSRELTITMIAQSIGVWCVPYLFGRLVATSADEHHTRIMGASVAVICVLALWGLFETFVGFNPVNTVLGRPDFGGSFRWGLRRAEGPLQHPIHFGNMMLMLFPWTLEAARRGFAGKGPFWWRFTPFIGFLGVFASLSRGPIIGVFIVISLVTFLRVPRLRPAMINSGLLVFTAILLFAGQALSTLQKSSGEEQEWGAFVVNIDGKDYQYTGTNHRLLQFRVLREPLGDAGWFGFGTWGIKPKHLAYVSPKLRAKFWSIDNHYIFMTLRSGYVGIGLFLALGSTALYYAIRIGFLGRGDALLASAMSGALLASLILLWSVWFAPDFAFVWLTSVGLIGGWWARALTENSQPKSAA